MAEEPTQLDKIKDLARKPDADEDEARWDEWLKKVVAVEPAPEPEKSE